MSQHPPSLLKDLSRQGAAWKQDHQGTQQLHFQARSLSAHESNV